MPLIALLLLGVEKAESENVKKSFNLFMMSYLQWSVCVDPDREFPRSAPICYQSEGGRPAKRGGATQRRGELSFVPQGGLTTREEGSFPARACREGGIRRASSALLWKRPSTGRGL